MPKILSDKELAALVRDKKVGPQIMMERPTSDMADTDPDKILADLLVNVILTSKEVASALSAITEVNKEQMQVLHERLLELIKVVESAEPTVVRIAENNDVAWDFSVQRDANNFITHIYARRM